jgi:beta-glucosidase
MTSLSPRGTVLPEDLPGLTAFGRSLPLEDKVRLLTGESVWKLHGIPSIGLRPIAVSDGPAGVRGLGETKGATSALFPAPSAIGATWDPELAAAIGRAFSQEARERGVDLVLAPQVNIQRTPVGGRHFECYSEDPHLTSLIGTAVIQGLQSQGVAASVKHYIANDSETDRTTYIAQVEPQALREVYLAPFEHAVEHGKVWSVMAAYNSVDDGTVTAQMTDHHALVVDLLKNELGFDGVVVSDWMATKDTEGAALGGLDLVMPGPGGPWEQHLLDAVRSGAVPEPVIDDKVGRILLLASRVGALGDEPQQLGPEIDVSALIRAAAAQSTVVLARDEENPVWDRPAPASIALIGPNAVSLHVLGGGSSTVRPAHVVSPEEGVRARFPDADVRVARGGDARRLAPELDVINRAATDALFTATILDDAGAVIATRSLDEWDGWMWDLPDDAHSVALSVGVRLDEPGVHHLEIGTVGGHRIVIDGQLASEDEVAAGVEVVLDSTINHPPGRAVAVEIDEPRIVQIQSTHLVTRAGGYGAIVRAAFRHRVPSVSGDEEIAAAVELARTSELTILIVGTNEEVESEGFDRTSLALPGRQDELVEAVLDVDPHAVIIVNAGAPVLLPWLERASTVLWCWFPGQEAGHSLAAVVAGDLEPAGRLPWTLPANDGDVPVRDAVPDAEGVIHYSDGVHVGYRAWERDALEPARPFGFGLGWTDWSYESIGTPRWTEAGDLEVDVTVANTGTRDGRETVQLYLEPPEDTRGINRPVRWLGGFASAEVSAGQTRQVTVVVPGRRFETWDTARARWIRPQGTYRVAVGRSVRELLLDTAVQLETPREES